MTHLPAILIYSSWVTAGGIELLGQRKRVAAIRMQLLDHSGLAWVAVRQRA